MSEGRSGTLYLNGTKALMIALGAGSINIVLFALAEANFLWPCEWSAQVFATSLTGIFAFCWLIKLFLDEIYFFEIETPSGENAFWATLFSVLGFVALTNLASKGTAGAFGIELAISFGLAVGNLALWSFISLCIAYGKRADARKANDPLGEPTAKLRCLLSLNFGADLNRRNHADRIKLRQHELAISAGYVLFFAVVFGAFHYEANLLTPSVQWGVVIVAFFVIFFLLFKDTIASQTFNFGLPNRAMQAVHVQSHAIDVRTIKSFDIPDELVFSAGLNTAEKVLWQEGEDGTSLVLRKLEKIKTNADAAANKQPGEPEESGLNERKENEGSAATRRKKGDGAEGGEDAQESSGATGK